MNTAISSWEGHEADGGVIDWIVGGNRSWTVTVPGPGWVLTGRAVFLAATAVAILLLAGIGVVLSRKAELRRRWTTWAIIIPAVGFPIWVGRGTTALLAAALGLQSVRELSRLTRLPRVEILVLASLAVIYPLAAWLRPGLMALAPLTVLVCAVPAVLSGDVEHGLRRATIAGFASIWIPWSLAHLVVLWHDAFLIAFAAAAADVAAWAGPVRRSGAGAGPPGPSSSRRSVSLSGSGGGRRRCSPLPSGSRRCVSSPGSLGCPRRRQ